MLHEFPPCPPLAPCEALYLNSVFLGICYGAHLLSPIGGDGGEIV